MAVAPEVRPFRLDGRTAFVTGAGSGIGAAIAVRLAEAGCSVAVNDIDPHRAKDVTDQLARAGATALAVPGDVADAIQSQEAVTRAVDEMGTIDILVNNAASWVDLKPLWDLSSNDIDASMSSFYAALYTIRAALPHLDQGGRIVNITSIAATVGGYQMSVYGAAKAAIHGLTAGLAKELAPREITINSVAPGLIDTPRQRTRPPETVAKRTRSVPLGRAGTADEVAYAVVFLASAESAYITGEVIAVDGGRP